MGELAIVCVEGGKRRVGGQKPALNLGHCKVSRGLVC